MRALTDTNRRRCEREKAAYAATVTFEGLRAGGGGVSQRAELMGANSEVPALFPASSSPGSFLLPFLLPFFGEFGELRRRMSRESVGVRVGHASRLEHQRAPRRT